MNNDFARRHYPFAGCFNFREIGGYPTADGRRVRWGSYFRAGRQDRMTRADRQRLAELGIKSQLDLRGTEEIREQGLGPLAETGANYHHIPVIPEGGGAFLSNLVGDGNISGNRYLAYLEFGAETWRRLFGVFADPNRLPVLVHCTAGKDRTGVATAFLLGVLGVEADLIEADYRLTNLDGERQVDFLEAEGALWGDREELLSLVGVPSQAMGDFIRGVNERFGSLPACLHSFGIDEDMQAAVRDNFLEA